MDTKWKNRMHKIFVKMKNNGRAILGILLMIVGVVFFYGLIAYHQFYVTEDAWCLAIVANILFTPGEVLFFHSILVRKLEKWVPENDGFYEEWKEKRRRYLQRLVAVTGVGLLCVCMYLLFLTFEWNYGCSRTNYASGYAMIITVFIQSMACRSVISHIMQDKLELLMEHMTEFSRKRLKEALEIEKESLKKAMEIERKSLEKVSRSDQLRIDLITNVSHDLKTPLTSMVGYMELMRKEELSDTVRDYLDVITDKAAKLKEMIESLFSLAKASSGNVEFHMETIEMNRLIEQIYADMEDKITESGLEIVTILTDEETKITTDNLYMYRICQNLIENALKYSARGTRVFVKTFYKSGLTGNQLCMEVTNTAGYHMDFQKEDIIERFARADKSRTTEGNGLGLAIVSTYASALGGMFDIDIDCDQFKAKLAFPIPEEGMASCKEDETEKS